MNPYRRRFGTLSSPWIVSGTSVTALALLVFYWPGSEARPYAPQLLSQERSTNDPLRLRTV